MLFDSLSGHSAMGVFQAAGAACAEASRNTTGATQRLLRRVLLSIPTRLGLHYADIKDAYEVSPDLFRSVRDEGPWREEEHRGNPGFSDKKVKQIETEWEQPQYSRVTADHQGEPGVDTFEGAPDVRVLLCHPSHVARDIERRGVCSWASAMRNRPDHVLNARRKTDMCSICLSYRRCLSKVTDFAQQFAKDHPEHSEACGIDMEKWARALEESHSFEAWQATELAEDLAVGQHHLDVVSRINDNFRAQVKEIREGLANAILICEDYKESVKIGPGVGPVQQDGEHFGEGSVSVCGYVVYLPGRATPIYVDLNSVNVSHSGEVSTHNLRRVIERLATDPETKDAFEKAEEIRVWSDCGKHFRTLAVAKYVLVDLPTKYSKKVQLNFFGEKHGKSPVDAHFGALAGYLGRWRGAGGRGRRGTTRSMRKSSARSGTSRTCSRPSGGGTRKRRRSGRSLGSGCPRCG